MTDNSTTEEKKITRTRATEDISILHASCLVFGMTPHDVAEEFGYTRSAASGWIKDGAIPAVLAHGLRLKSALKTASQKIVVIGKLKSNVPPEAAHLIIQSIFEEYTFGE